MPPGSKKRKAAKKKKGKVTNTSTNPQGANELKSQDEKGSDCGSPSFHNHGDDHDHPFKEGKQEKSEPSAAQPSTAEDAKSTAVVPSDVNIGEAERGKQDVALERDSQSRESSESEGVTLVEPAKESDNRNEGNSSDDLNDETIHQNAKDEPKNSVKEAVTFDDLVKSIEEVPSDVKIGKAEGGKQDVALERDLKSRESVESEGVGLVEPAKESDYRNGENSSGGLDDETVYENAKDEPENLVKEVVPFDDLVKSIDSSHAKMSSIAQNAQIEDIGNSVPESPVVPVTAVGDTGNSVLESPVDPVRAVDSISEVTGSDPGSALPEKSVASQVGPIDLAVKKNGDKVHPFSEGTEHVKDSETAESSENQPLVATAPRVVQKTSWLNCCGLFEVLTGSNR